MATQEGLYRTKYEYVLINDLSCYDTNMVNDIYKSSLTTIVEPIISDYIELHENTKHLSSSIIGRADKTIDVAVNTDPTNWSSYELSSIDNETVEIYTNDTVQNVYFGDYGSSNNISIIVENFITNITPQFNYIKKVYKSGMVELYILIDTTNTYYINHVDNAGYSLVKDDKFERKNLKGIYDEEINSSEISNLMTNIKIILNKQEFDIDRVYGCEINGCSLPLKIYQDDDSVQSASNIKNMYQSVILPSKFVMSENKLYIDDNDCVEFNAKCFGTDQQSIKITYS